MRTKEREVLGGGLRSGDWLLGSGRWLCCDLDNPDLEVFFSCPCKSNHPYPVALLNKSQAPKAESR